MKVEILIILFIFFMFFVWAIWYNLSTRNLLKKYNKFKNKLENKSENGKERNNRNKRNFFARKKRRIGNSIENSSRLSEPSERELLETTGSSSVGKDNNDVGKNSKSTRGFFRRLRNKRRRIKK